MFLNEKSICVLNGQIILGRAPKIPVQSARRLPPVPTRRAKAREPATQGAEHEAARLAQEHEGTRADHV